MNSTIFGYLYPKYTINKPIRLIELFAGIGSQAKALTRIGANFEHYKVVEFDKYVIRFSTNSNKHFIVVGELPTYDEYFEEYKKNSKLLNKIYSEQIKSLHKFEQWLDDNKTKTFTHEELEEKMLELKLSYKGFNGG